jgi:hypothetical protein
MVLIILPFYFYRDHKFCDHIWSQFIFILKFFVTIIYDHKKLQNIRHICD